LDGIPYEHIWHALVRRADRGAEQTVNNAGAYVGGGFLLVLGISLIWAHQRARRVAASEGEPEDEFERRYVASRYRRRMQTSALIALIGVMVAASPLVIPDPRTAPKLFGIWWLSALLVTMWVVLLAVADIMATKAHTTIAHARIRVHQEQLERELREMQKHKGNGRHSGSVPPQNGSVG
jgi:hypothetical protein